MVQNLLEQHRRMVRTKGTKLEALSLYCMLFFHPGFQGLEQHSIMLIKKYVFISLFILSISVTVGGSQQNYSIMYFSRLKLTLTF